MDRHLHAMQGGSVRELHSGSGEERTHVGLVLEEVDAADDEDGGLGDAGEQVGEGGKRREFGICVAPRGGRDRCAASPPAGASPQMTR